MAKAKNHMLEKELASKVYYDILLNKKDGISAYSIGKDIYGPGFRASTKIYGIKKELNTKNLIKIETVKEGKREKELMKPNIMEFIKILNEQRFNDQLNIADIEDLTKLLTEFDIKKAAETTLLPSSTGYKDTANTIITNIRPLNVLDSISIILKTGAYYSEMANNISFPRNSDKSLKALYEQIKPFRNLSKDLIIKMKNVITPTHVDQFISTNLLFLNILKTTKR